MTWHAKINLICSLITFLYLWMRRYDKNKVFHIILLWIWLRSLTIVCSWSLPWASWPCRPPSPRPTSPPPCRMYTLSSGMSAIFTLGAWGSILRFSSRRDLRQEINKSIHNNSFLVFLPDPVYVLGRVMVAHVFRGDVDLEVEARVLEVVIVRQLVRIERVWPDAWESLHRGRRQSKSELLCGEIFSVDTRRNSHSSLWKHFSIKSKKRFLIKSRLHLHYL